MWQLQASGLHKPPWCPQTDLQISFLSEWGPHWFTSKPTCSLSVESPAQLRRQLYPLVLIVVFTHLH